MVRLAAMSATLKRKIKPQEIDEVVKILLSDDPEVVRKAFSGQGNKDYSQREHRFSTCRRWASTSPCRTPPRQGSGSTTK